MNFKLTEQQEQLRDAARKFAQSSLRDVAKTVEEEGLPLPQEWVGKMAHMGLLGVNIDQQYGGLGLSHLDAVLVLEEVAKISPAVAFPIFESSFGPMLAISHFASEELKQRVMPRVCAGELIVAVSMSEPDAGSALTDLKTRGVVSGDKIVINGQKRWCSGAGHSGAYMVYCRLSDRLGSGGIGAVYVEKETPGLTFGKQERLMGFRGIASADMYFDNVEIPLSNLIVPAGGFKKLMEAFDLERCGNATMSVALATGALDYVLDYVRQRRQFGKPIMEFQAVQMKLAEMAMRVEAARLLLYQAVVNAQDGLPSIKESSMAKCFANEMVR
ncbi:MAG: acyl-CoA dehydrogenase family protein, partial [Burkholderiaceae bacterium]